ncbi:MAG: VWA domain-containing protein, partial [Candidatus Binatia bacterium]
MRKLNQRGSFIIWLTLAFALIGTFIGFALDFGHAYLEKARMARLIDAAAIAAAKALKGQPGLWPDAVRAACDSMTMNGAPVVMSGNNCVATQGAQFIATPEPIELEVPGGPPVTAVRISAVEPVPTTFLRFLGWMVPGNYSTINVRAVAEAGPERPVDLVLVLDRSFSMSVRPPGSSDNKLEILKDSVNEFLSNSFTANDRIGMVSFSNRGCGDSSGGDSIAVTCTADVAMTDATDSNLTMLKNRVNGLDLGNLTNTQEALRTARSTIAPVFNDSTRTTTRKAILLVTDGKPTVMRIDSETKCRQDPKGNPLPNPYNSTNFPSGACLQTAISASGSEMERLNLNSSDNPGDINGSTLFQNVISCTRSLSSCNGGTNGAMYEADLLRNCGAGNTDCTAGGEHDVLVFAIGIGAIHSTPNRSFDKNAKCLLVRIANATG